jgi:hypothetical protein
LRAITLVLSVVSFRPREGDRLRRLSSDADLDVAESACDLVEAIDRKLTAQAHGRSAPVPADVKDALDAAEIALRRILV